jgi:putative MATE family efflux protein
LVAVSWRWIAPDYFPAQTKGDDRRGCHIRAFCVMKHWLCSKLSGTLSRAMIIARARHGASCGRHSVKTLDRSPGDPGLTAGALSLPHPPIERRVRVPGMTRAVFRLAWPAVIEQLLIAGVDLTDVLIVGHLGATALSAVGLTGQVVNLAIAFFGAIGVGCMVLVARHIGAGEHADASRAIQQSILVSGALGACVALLCWLLAPDILRSLGAAPDVVERGASFMRIIALSLPLMAIAFVGTSAMRAAGDTRTPMLLTGLQLAINAALGYLLVYGPPQLHVEGLGWATTTARTMLGLLVLALLWRGRPGVHLAGDRWRPDFSRLKRVLSVGLPAGVEQVLLQFALVNLATVIAGLGTVAYAAHSVSIRIMSLSFLPGWGFAVAAAALVGQGLGAKDTRRAEDSAYGAYRLALLAMSALGIALYLLDEPLLGIFTNDQAVIAASIPVIHVAAFAQPFMATSFVFMNALRGAGDTRATLTITVTSIWTIRLGLAYLGAHVFGWGLPGAWLGILGDFVFRAAFAVFRFRGGRWKTIKV